MIRTRFLFAGWPVALLLLFFLPACYTQTPPRPQVPPRARVEADARYHYRQFETAEALAAYLRAGSPAGPLVSAHRGGPAPGYPENALATFERALRFGPVLIECDVRLSADSVLVLLHDETLQRTTTGEGLVQETPLRALRRLRLTDPLGRPTPFRLPTLAEALAWSQGRAVLTLDVKRGVPPARVVQAVRAAGATNRVVVIAYTLEDLRRYHRLAPELSLSASAESVAEAEDALEAVDPSRLMVFTGVGEVRPLVIERLHAANVRAVMGTFGGIDVRARRAGPAVFEGLFARGLGIITTDEVRIAARAAQGYETAPQP